MLLTVIFLTFVVVFLGLIEAQAACEGPQCDDPTPTLTATPTDDDDDDDDDDCTPAPTQTPWVITATPEPTATPTPLPVYDKAIYLPSIHYMDWILPAPWWKPERSR